MTAGTTLLPPVQRPRRERTPDGWPPQPPTGGGEGGGGGGGDGDGDAEPWPEGHGPPAGTSELGFGLFLFGIGTLFVVLLGAWIVVRKSSGPWPVEGQPPPPHGLWASTGLLVLSSATMVAAVRARRRGSMTVFRRWLGVTTLLGAGFLAAQAWLWQGMLADGLTTSSHAYGAVFYTLTGMHALHVVGGLAFQLRLLAALRLARGPTRVASELCGVYWHFMGAVWVVLFTVLYLFDR